ncbi:MAG TPA: hypothetical protein VGI54_07720 [Solirubrobacteraceae bacterium]|jgi:hypothetical protein
MSDRILHYDTVRRRLWILGQRCHHGATGALVAGAAMSGLAARAAAPVPTLVLAAAGSVLMAHDWHDRSLWFVPGHQDQP